MTNFKYIKKISFVTLVITSFFITAFSNDIQNKLNLETGSSIEELLNENFNSVSETLTKFKILNFKQPKVLFIVGDNVTLDPVYDLPFYNNMTALGIEVTTHSDDNSYSISNFDAVVISQSIVEQSAVDTLSNASIPILTMESFNYQEFRLGSGRGADKNKANFLIDNGSNHYILENYSNQLLEIYNPIGDLHFIKDYSVANQIHEIVSLASPELQPLVRRTLLALDKDKKDWLGLSTPERRAFWGAGEGNIITSAGWSLWIRTLNWVLYDDIIGNATIDINTFDLGLNDISGAEVNITDINSGQTRTQFTNSEGLTSFIDVPFGQYNITAEFDSTINSSLTMLEIVGTHYYDISATFSFSIAIDVYTDKNLPTISNLEFFSGNLTFSAEITDESNIAGVTLSLTAINATNGSILRDGTFDMVTINGLQYFNDSALSGLSGSGLSVNYNVTAIDEPGNIQISENRTFTLGDFTTPIIHEYNSTILGNGTVLFYANITDDLSLVDQVILKINDTFVDMSLNSTGWWIYTANYDVTYSLNFTIFSTYDSIGNEAGLNKSSLNPLPDFYIVNLFDSQAPHIYGVSDSFNSHDKGYVQITVFVDDWNDFQIGVNQSSVSIVLTIDNGTIHNITLPMESIGAIAYSFEYTFGFNDNVSYFIVASDLSINFAIGNLHENLIIDDKAKPIVNYGVQEFGNGTIEFSSIITDWPSNQTGAKLFYAQNFFGSWINIDMIKLNDTYFNIRVQDLSFQTTNLWYYIISSDTNGNSFIPTPDQYLNVTLTDMVVPIVNFSIENSTTNDGETTINAFAIDPYGISSFVNNTFNIKFTTSQTVINAEMNYDSFYTYVYTQSFIYGESVTIEVTTQDDAGNFGNLSRSYIILDYSPPKVNDYGVVNHQNGSITLWAEVVENSLGSGLFEDNSSVILEYIFKIPFTEIMTWNGTGNYYSITISGFEPGDAIPYNIKVTDKVGNTNSTPLFSDPYLLFIKPEIIDFGIEYPTDITHVGKTHVWVEMAYPFSVKPELFVSLTDHSSSESWVNQSMRYNGTHFVYDQSIPYQHNYSYVISLTDIGTIRGEYAIDPLIGSTYQMPDYWAPIIHETGAIQLDDSVILVWANVSDSGSNVSEVVVLYDFEPVMGSARLLLINDVQNIPMTFNGSLYVVTIPVSDSGTFSWGIMASDNTESVIETSLNNQLLFIVIKPSNGFESLYLYIIIGIVAFLFLFVIIRAFFSRKKKKRLFLLESVQKLDDIEKIFMINVQNSDGLPIVVQKSSVNPQFDVDPTMLAGYVSATSSVRGELISQMSIESAFQEDSGIVSKIEQSSDGKLNIITTISDDIIFLTYTSGVAKKWWNDLQLEAHKSLIDAIKPMIGRVLVDDSIRLPATKAISECIPLVLLEKFTIFPDIPTKGDSYNEIILKKAVLTNSPISSQVPKMSGKKTKKEFKKFIEKAEILPDFTIQSLRTILINVLKLPPDEVLNIIWESAINNVFKKLEN
ncbi:MAG: hypothetical protein ACW981_11780 [Candidatus Hodarchaeales archaeon]|jgi:hypothetical protein